MTEQLREAFGAGLLVGSRYRVEELIGAGGMSTVWRAQDELLGRPVAIKLMSDALASDPAYVARFAREARTAASVSHANLVQIFDYGEAESRPYLVMEYVDGGTLGARLDRGPMRAAEVRELACQLLSAIGCVHRVGVLHRDIKPANVLCGSDGRARLTDFGIARLEDGLHLTEPGLMIGTLRYIAPELIEGAPPSRRSDLYALGVMLREIRLCDEPDPAVGYVIARLTQPRPEERPRDAETALRRLVAAGAVAGRDTQEFDAVTAGVDAGAWTPPPTRRLRAAASTRRHAPPADPRGARRAAVAALTAAVVIFLTLLAIGAGGTGAKPGTSQARAAVIRRAAAPARGLDQRLVALERTIARARRR